MDGEINHVQVWRHFICIDCCLILFYVLIIGLYCFKNNKILYPDKMTRLEVKVVFFSFHCAYWYFCAFL